MVKGDRNDHGQRHGDRIAQCGLPETCRSRKWQKKKLEKQYRKRG